MDKRPEKIEKEFDTLMESINYERVDDYINKSPDFSNADYINVNKKIVAELKVIDKDFFKKEGVDLQAIVPIPIDVKPNGQGFYEFKVLKPNENIRLDTLEEPLRRIIKKANKQLRETNEKLLNSEGVGFLILAINMNTVIDPRIIQQLVLKFLKKEFKSIMGVIFCTPKVGPVLENGFFQPFVLHCQDARLSKKDEKELMFLVNSWGNFIDNDGHEN